MNAGDEGVEKEHEDHHAEDRQTLHQEDLVGYSVLWSRKNIFELGGVGVGANVIMFLAGFVLKEV